MSAKTWRYVLTNWPEELCVDFLKQSGYRILARNFCTAYGEMDIVALRDRVIHFVEVKSLREGLSLEAVDHVTPDKVKHILSVSRSYLQRLDREESIDLDLFDFAFDVYAVTTKPNSTEVTEARFYENYIRVDKAEYRRELYLPK